MPIEITMPKMSDTMEEGKILRWLKKPGDRVSVGEVLAEVETDKADMEIEATDAGVLAQVLVKDGDSAEVGKAIAILEDSEGMAETPAGAAHPQAAAEEEEAPGERRTLPPARAPREAGERDRRVSPPARRVASEQGIDAAKVTGSGPGGRVVKRDLERPPLKPAEPPAHREQLSKIRRTVARRMAESKREAPHFYVTAEIEMGDCARLKDSLASARSEGPAVSYTHLLLRAVAIALRDHPRLNARYAGEDAIEFPGGIHLGIATALDEGLIVPVLHDCGSKDVFEIALEARALVERVRAGKPQGADLSGGTFTVSNLGMFPVEEFAAVINPPQAAVLAVGSVHERAIVKQGVIVAAATMRVTLSCDHRVVDGAEAARFLATLKALLESPLRLILS